MTEQDATENGADEAASDDVEVESAPDGVDPETVDLSDVAAEDELVERIDDSEPAEIADELVALRSRVDELEAESEELEDKLKRKQAEFQNYKKRMQQRREEEKARATEDLVTRILDVRDNLERALGQDEDTEIRSGVESTLRQLDDVLQAENVEVIDPEPGEDVDPTQHQVLANVESEQESGSIADVHRPGYEMAEKVLREAQVTVSE